MSQGGIIPVPTVAVVPDVPEILFYRSSFNFYPSSTIVYPREIYD